MSGPPGRRANSIHMLTGQLMSKGAVFLAMMMLSRYLDDLWFGRLLFALALSFFSFFITDFGTAVLVNRDMSLSGLKNAGETWRNALGFRIITGSAAVAGIALFSILSYPRLQTLVLIPVLLGMTLEIFCELPFSLFRSAGRTRHEASARTLSSLVFLAAVFGMIRAEAHPVILGSAFLVRGIILAVSSFTAASSMGMSPFPVFRRHAMIRLFREAWPLGLMGFLTVLHQRADNLVIENRLGIESVGAYNEIFKVLEVLILVVTPTLLPGSLFPGLCRAFSSGVPEARRETGRIAFLISALSATVTALVLPSGKLFMRLLWGGSFLRGVAPEEFETTRMILFAAIPVYYFMNFLMSALIASGRQKATLPAVLAGFVISISVNLSLVGSMGLVGAGLAAILSNAAIALVCWLSLGRAAGPEIVPAAVLGALPVPAVLFIGESLPWSLTVTAGLLCALPSVFLWRRSLGGRPAGRPAPGD